MKRDWERLACNYCYQMGQSWIFLSSGPFAIRHTRQEIVDDWGRSVSILEEKSGSMMNSKVLEERFGSCSRWSVWHEVKAKCGKLVPHTQNLFSSFRASRVPQSFPAGTENRTHKLRVTSLTLWPFGRNCPVLVRDLRRSWCLEQVVGRLCATAVGYYYRYSQISKRQILSNGTSDWVGE